MGKAFCGITMIPGHSLPLLPWSHVHFHHPNTGLAGSPAVSDNAHTLSTCVEETHCRFLWNKFLCHPSHKVVGRRFHSQRWKLGGEHCQSPKLRPPYVLTKSCAVCLTPHPPATEPGSSTAAEKGFSTGQGPLNSAQKSSTVCLRAALHAIWSGSGPGTQ